MIEMRLNVERKQDYELNDEERRRVLIQHWLERKSLWRRQDDWKRPQPEGWDYDEVEAVIGVEDFKRDAPFSNSVVNGLLHLQRAKLLHKLEDIPGLEVKDWEDTDDDKPHEAVQIIVALGSAGVITAVVNIIKIWVEKDKIKRATISLPNGATLTVERATAEEIQSFIITANQLLPDQETKKLPPKKSD